MLSRSVFPHVPRQSDIRHFIEVTLAGDKQVLGALAKAPVHDPICVFVCLGGTGHDRIFVFYWSDLQAVVVSGVRDRGDLLHPERVVQSFSDSQAHLYYRFYFRTIVGGKFLCVVVKSLDADAFVLTAYLTDRIKQGVPIWPTENKQ